MSGEPLLKPNSFRDMNFQKWSITDESFINVYETDNLHNSSVIDHLRKLISRQLLSFEQRFTTHFLPHGHSTNMYGFLFPFSKFVAKIFDSEHLGRFFKKHPLYTREVIQGMHCMLSRSTEKYTFTFLQFCFKALFVVSG